MFFLVDSAAVCFVKKMKEPTRIECHWNAFEWKRLNLMEILLSWKLSIRKSFECNAMCRWPTNLHRADVKRWRSWPYHPTHQVPTSKLWSFSRVICWWRIEWLGDEFRIQKYFQQVARPIKLIGSLQSASVLGSSSRSFKISWSKHHTLNSIQFSS